MERPLDTIRAFHAAAEGTGSRPFPNTGGRGMLKWLAADGKVQICPDPSWIGLQVQGFVNRTRYPRH